MEPDFSGWATKAGLKCSDGRTIMPDAFKHQDQVQVPLVWQHGHSDPTNVLGHAILTNKDEGVWADAYFNGTDKALHAKAAVEHKDINHMSIWANQLVERSKRVFHGAIREVSLVLSGANPGALIQNVTIRHSDDGADDEVLSDEVFIFTEEELVLEHATKTVEKPKKVETPSSDAGDDETIQDVYDTLTDKQKKVVDYMVGQAIDNAGSGDAAAQSDLDLGDDESYKATYESMNEDQRSLLHSMVDEALKSKGNSSTGNDDKSDKSDKSAEHSDLNDGQKGDEMKHNIFEKDENDNKGGKDRVVLSHSEVKAIVEDAAITGSLKKSVEAYALAHGITDIDVLFPEARTIQDAPDFISRRMEWVQKLLGGTRKSPFTRIKTILADITVQEARAKGYIKGTLKKEEFFNVARRITTPTTIYKKQKLDRDDIVDITDFDVVVWLKGEMRLMLDEEIARAILLGDGRAVDDPDKINEGNIRPIVSDHEVYVTTLTIPMDDTPARVTAAIDALALARSEYRGTGNPTLFTTNQYLARMLLLKDSTGRKIYRNIDELTTDLRVQEIVPVEPMEEYPDLFGVLVNPVDYVVGTDRGGEVSLFDFFDIDYNQQKYLIETRMSGALIKFKCAIVVRTTVATDTPVVPTPPTFDGTAVTIVDTPNVVYRNDDTDAVLTAAGSPYAVAPDSTMHVVATAAAGYYVEDNTEAYWSFTNNG